MHFDNFHLVGSAHILHVVTGLAVLAFLTAALGPTAVYGQASDSLVVTSEDVRGTLTEGCSFYRMYLARLDENATPEDSTQFEKKVRQLTKQVREGGPYDLTPFSYTPADSGVTYTRPISAFSAVPGADSARGRGANYTYVSLSANGSHWLEYLGVAEDGMYVYGDVSSHRRDPNLSEPPRRGLAFPLRTGLSWLEQEGASTEFRVVGSGALVTPTGTTPTLAVTTHRQTPQTDRPARVGVRFIDREGEMRAAVYHGRKVRRIRYWDRSEIKTGVPPEGFTVHCAYPGDVPVSFPVPDDWTVATVHPGAKMSLVNLARDPAAVGPRRSGEGDPSAEAARLLRTPENVWISLSSYAREEQPQEYLEGLTLGSLNDAEVIQPVSERAVQGRTAYEKAWRGTGDGGHALVSRRIVFRAADRLFEVRVHQPPEMPGDAETALQVFLDHLTVGL